MLDAAGGGLQRDGVWKQNYSESPEGSFKPVSNLLSYDSNDPNGPTAFGEKLYWLVNALYCPPKDLMAWDRGVLLVADSSRTRNREIWPLSVWRE